jgi:hypothetical protein
VGAYRPTSSGAANDVGQDTPQRCKSFDRPSITALLPPGTKVKSTKASWCGASRHMHHEARGKQTKPCGSPFSGGLGARLTDYRPCAPSWTYTRHDLRQPFLNGPTLPTSHCRS